MPKENHEATFAVYNKWRAQMTQKMGGEFDWAKVSESEMRALSGQMLEAAKVPGNIRREYWTAFEQMKAALSRR